MLLSLKKGKIYLCDSKGNKRDYVEFSFNPSSYTIKSTPVYKTVQNLGKDSTSSVFLSGASRELSATLYFDSLEEESGLSLPGLGLQSLEAMESQAKPVTDKTKKLMATVAVEGEQHKPPQVIFSWGNLNFKGVITSLTEEYTMFNKDGKPVRAKVSINIREDSDEALMKMSSPFESPDRTKSRVAVEGMSLWLLAYEEYDDCEKWRRIARANHIMNPLDLVPGQVIKVPALEEDGDG